MTSTRAWWIACLIAGIITITTSLYFGMIPNIEATEVPDGINSIIAFEIVRTPADVAALFTDQAIANGFLEAMHHATWVDALVFIPAYTLFLCAALMALRPLGSKVAIAGVIVALLAALFDQIEGVQLFRIMDALPGTQAMIDILIPMVRGKFALLGLTALAVGWLLSKPGGWGRLAGLLVTLGGAVTMFGLSSDEQSGFLGLGGLISWLTLFVVAVVQVVRGRSRP